MREASRYTYQDSWEVRIEVEKLTGNDDKTRCVRVKRSDGSEEVYSVSHLYPLKISLLAESDVAPKKAKDPVKREPSQRRAALKCIKKFKLIN